MLAALMTPPIEQQSLWKAARETGWEGELGWLVTGPDPANNMWLGMADLRRIPCRRCPSLPCLQHLSYCLSCQEGWLNYHRQLADKHGHGRHPSAVVQWQGGCSAFGAEVTGGDCYKAMEDRCDFLYFYLRSFY